MKAIFYSIRERTSGQHVCNFHTYKKPDVTSNIDEMYTVTMKDAAKDALAAYGLDPKDYTIVTWTMEWEFPQ